jgi:hypothetical protein
LTALYIVRNGALPDGLKKGDFSEMAEQPCYTYWTVECKTPSCGGLLLAYIGPFDKRRVLFLPQCRPFEVICPECKNSYTYTRNDVTSKNLALEPKGFIPSQPFLEAIADHLTGTEAAEEFFRNRAAGARRGALREALHAVPDNPPDPGDEL